MLSLLQLMARWQKVASDYKRLSKEELQALAHYRREAQTNLYWLAKDILDYRDMVTHVHQQICDNYVHKNPDLTIEEQSEVKTRAVFAPRGCFKTCVDIADVVQWILCFPEIRILILTGKQDLAERMIGELKVHFQRNPKLRFLFPNFCPDPESKFGLADEFTTPARQGNYREPTVSIATIASNKAGGHYNVIKPDDVVNEINSVNIDQCLKVIEAYTHLGPLLEPGGYFEINGTFYSVHDLYCHLIKQAARAAIEDAEDAEDGETIPPEIQVLIMAAWQVKEGHGRDEGNGYLRLKAADVDLLFPERLKFRFLYKQYRQDPTIFSFQYLNNPDVADIAKRPFTSAMIDSHTIPYTQLPLPSEATTYLCWDLAGPNPKANSDYSVGVVGQVDKVGRLYITDMVRCRVNALRIAGAVVDLSKKYPNAVSTWIEDAPGVRFLEPTILTVAANAGVDTRITWAPVDRNHGGAAKSGKRIKIDFLQQLLVSDRLWFAASLPFLDDLKAELLDASPTHDDCGDAIATLVQQLKMGAAAATVVPPAEAMKARMKEMAERAFEQAMYGDDEPTPGATQGYNAGILGYGHAA